MIASIVVSGYPLAMPRPLKLKVFRTPIGFHDAYVAAPSQKAALEAWGSEKNLFAQGSAELVTDPELTGEPLASPGTVIRRLRGTAAEQLAALPPDAPRAAPKKGTKAKPAPRPSRKELDAAEAAMDEAEAEFERRIKAIADEEAALARTRRDLERERDAAVAQLARQRYKARDRFDRALARWRG